MRRLVVSRLTTSTKLRRYRGPTADSAVCRLFACRLVSYRPLGQRSHGGEIVCRTSASDGMRKIVRGLAVKPAWAELRLRVPQRRRRDQYSCSQKRGEQAAMHPEPLPAIHAVRASTWHETIAAAPSTVCMHALRVAARMQPNILTTPPRDTRNTHTMETCKRRRRARVRTPGHQFRRQTE